jgi:hypothetical protein
MRFPGQIAIDCVGCSSALATERSDLKAQDYRRFRCRDCDRQFNVFCRDNTIRPTKPFVGRSSVCQSVESLCSGHGSPVGATQLALADHVYRLDARQQEAAGGGHSGTGRCQRVEVGGVASVRGLVGGADEAGTAYVPFFTLGGFTPLQSTALSDVAKSFDATPMQVALAWLLTRARRTSCSFPARRRSDTCTKTSRQANWNCRPTRWTGWRLWCNFPASLSSGPVMS